MSEQKKIVGIGYNGMPNGCDDDLLPWAREATSSLDTKYPYGTCKSLDCIHLHFFGISPIVPVVRTCVL